MVKKYIFLFAALSIFFCFQTVSAEQALYQGEPEGVIETEDGTFLLLRIIQEEEEEEKTYTCQCCQGTL